MGSLFPLLITYGPQILQAIFGVENAVSQAKTKMTSDQKLNAAKAAVLTVVPAIANSINVTPDHSMHLNDYIGLAVNTMNAAGSWAADDAALQKSHGPLADAGVTAIASSFEAASGTP